MAAQTTEGTGNGSVENVTTHNLSKVNNGPSILIAGVVSAAELLSSPPAIGNTVTFQVPLPGLGEEHCVILTTLNGGYAYVTDMDDQDLDEDNEDDHFTGFSFYTESECDVMYIVTKVGAKTI